MGSQSACGNGKSLMLDGVAYDCYDAHSTAVVVTDLALGGGTLTLSASPFKSSDTVPTGYAEWVSLGAIAATGLTNIPRPWPRVKLVAAGGATFKAVLLTEKVC